MKIWKCYMIWYNEALKTLTREHFVAQIKKNRHVNLFSLFSSSVLHLLLFVKSVVLYVGSEPLL